MILPVVKAFAERNSVADMVVVGDAGILSATNQEATEVEGLRFIVGSHLTKAADDLAKRFIGTQTMQRTSRSIDTVAIRRADQTRSDPAGFLSPSGTLRDVTLQISDQHITATPTITDKATEILDRLEISAGHKSAPSRVENMPCVATVAQRQTNWQNCSVYP